MNNPTSAVAAFLEKHRLDPLDGIQMAVLAAEEGRVDVIDHVFSSPDLFQHFTHPDFHLLATIAASEGKGQIIDCLVRHKIDLAKDIPTLAQLAAQYGQTDVLHCLQQHGLDLHAEGFTLAKIATEYGQVDILKWLANNEVDLKQNNNQLAKLAVQFIHVDVIEFLLQQNEIASGVEELAKLAAKNGRTNIIECLMSHFPELANDGLQLAKVAAIYGRINVIEFLAEKGVNFKDDFLDLAKRAIKYGHTDVVDLLIVHKMLDTNDLSVMNELTSFAITYDQPHAVKFLLKNSHAKELIEYQNCAIVIAAAKQKLMHHVSMLLEIVPEMVEKKEVSAALAAANMETEVVDDRKEFRQGFFRRKPTSSINDEPSSPKPTSQGPKRD